MDMAIPFNPLIFLSSSGFIELYADRISSGSANAAGEALTLTHADTCIFVEMDWVPAAMHQAEDLGHRAG